MNNTNAASIRILELDLASDMTAMLNGTDQSSYRITAPLPNGLGTKILAEIETRAKTAASELHAHHTRTIFASGEYKVTYDCSVAGRQVFILLNFPMLDETTMPAIIFKAVGRSLTNNYLQLAQIAANAARHSGASEVHLLVPNYPYARQDKTHGERGPISAELVAQQLSAAFDTVTSVHLHSAAIEGMMPPGKLTNISSSEIFAPQLICRDPETFAPIPASEVTLEGIKRLFDQISIASPDAGGFANARSFAVYCKKFAAYLANADLNDLPDIPVVVVDKRRTGPNVAEVMNVLGDVTGRHVIIVDDMVDTGGTAMKSAAVFKKNGATDVELYATHGYFNGNALTELTKSELSKVTVTDSMAPRPSVLSHTKINVISIAPVLTQVIADRTTQPEPNVQFEQRYMGPPNHPLGRYISAMAANTNPTVK